MTNITVRNIPDEVMSKIKILSANERRSLNNEILVLLETGLEKTLNEDAGLKLHANKETQLNIWEKLCGQWDDTRDTQEILADIRDRRTIGRQVTL